MGLGEQKSGSLLPHAVFNICGDARVKLPVAIADIDVPHLEKKEPNRL
jgi:hypothetical protein